MNPQNMDSSSSHRRGYSDAQLAALETAFLEDNYVTGERKTELAEATKLSKKQIKIWFDNRRKRMKISSKKASDIETSSQRPGFSKLQLDTLNAAFSENNYLERGRKVELVKTTGLTGTRITEWFKSQRKRQLKRSDSSPNNPLVFTSAQRDILVEAFAEDDYAKKKRKRDFAERTNLTEHQIRTWFKHERRRVEKRSEQETQADMVVAADEVENGQVEPIDVTPDQEAILLDMFLKHRWLNMGELADMMKRTGLEEEQVKKWFKRQRELVKDKVVIKEELEDDYE